MANAVNLPGDRLAGLDIDLKQKLKAGVRTLDELALFLQGKNPFALANYFTTRPGLYVYPSFATRVLPFAKEGDLTNISKVDDIDLPRNMSDTEIINTYLGGMEEAKKNAFTLPQLRTVLNNQWDGDDGPLLTNGYTNIFHSIGEDGKLVAVNAVRRDGGWRLGGWHLDELGSRGAGSRIFRNKP